MFLILPVMIFGQKHPVNTTYFNEIKKKNICTVQMYPSDWALTEPIIELNSTNQLLFSFDEIEENIQDYSYRIIHCTADWQNSNLSQFDYLDGFMENQIQDYERSFNTNVNYIHYSLQIPNEDIQLRLSGNYILEVYEDFDPDKVIIRQRFKIFDTEIEITGEVKQPAAISNRNTHQELNFSIWHPNFKIDNPQGDLKVILTQNKRFDGSQKKLKPLFIRKNELVFTDKSQNTFPGGNEFRNFDLKSLRYQTSSIQEISNRDGQTHVHLVPGHIRQFDRYIYDRDINGRYLIDVQESDEPNTEADYSYVTFYLPFDDEIKHGDLYVYGNFCNWQCSDINKMVYNFRAKCYQKTIFLKQGYYNYQYALLENGKQVPDLHYIEGNHWQTENEYTIYVYYHEFAGNYDRLIGYKTINSTAKF